ncbi:MAG TPA: ABC transporter substrate-binding protein [Acidimicrobiales bacterium]|nr:ABC transporter substrate-binding protein [Acidimicrobiales bacterium]
MSTNHSGAVWSRLLAALVMLSLAAAACGNSDDDSDSGDSGGDDGQQADSGDDSSPSGAVPGVTADEIRFSVFGTRTNNPTGACILDCFVDGINAYFAFRNDEGGVHGRDMVLTTELDDELSKNQEKALEIVSADDTFAAFSATQLANGWHDVAEAGIPLYVWGIHSAELNGQQGIFANNGVICGKCSSRSVPYVGTLLDATKVASMGYGVSQASKDCAGAVVDSVELYGDETGQEVGFFNDDLAFGLPNGIAPEVSLMKQADVDFVTACFDLNGMKTLAQEMERQGMGDVPMLHPNTYDQNFVAEAGDLFEGDMVQVGFRPFEADAGDTGLADFQSWMEETGSEPTEVAMVGWINADLAYQGLLAAGEGFDRAGVIEATNAITDYSATGLVNPIDWSRQHDAPTEDDPAAHGYVQECYSYVQVEDGEFHPVGDESKPFACWDNSDLDWSEPEPTNFG